MTNLADATDAGDVALFDYGKDYRAARHVADRHLESADVADLTEKARSLAARRHLLLPDADILLERCVVALLGGHLVLQGPPGTGKTTLASILARAFNVSSHLETATADWSTYDVIGGLHPSSRGGVETLEPWLGHVPRAAIECAGVISRHDDDEETEARQAHWLIIDEFSRAEIDKAIGPLYTVLGGGGDPAPLPLWFGDAEERSEVWLPNRFRIIGTMNTVDTNYVYTFSQGLSRRFQFIYVGVPSRDQIGEELHQARLSAAEWYNATYGAGTFKPDAFVNSPALAAATAVITSFLDAVRYDEDSRPGWPVGTAQVVDVYRQLATRVAGTGATDEDLTPALDLAFADRIVPQAGNLTSAQTAAVQTWVDGQALPRTATALRHLTAAAATGY